MKPLAPARAQSLIDAMAARHVLVLGDLMLDEFWWGDVARISPEAPVPVVEVTRQSYHLGGAGNVASNVRALGGRAVLAGVLGEDDAGRRVRAELEASGIDAAVVDARDGRPTTIKTRIIAHHQQVVRADRERSDAIGGDVEDELRQHLRRALPRCSAVIVSDYRKGVVTARLMKTLLAAARRRGLPVLVDPKMAHLGFYRGATLVTPNQGEAEQTTGVRITSDETLEQAGHALLRALNCKAALITRGEHGMSLFRPGKRPAHVSATAREVFDVTGAGDTVIAALGLALAAGARIEEAAMLANHAAGLVVGKIGTATVSARELLSAVKTAAR